MSFIKRLAGDLLTLEVNTIIKEDMAATKVPASRRVALLELAEDYRAKLDKLKICSMKPPTAPEIGEKDAEVASYFRWRFAGEFSFKELMKVASHGTVILEQRIADAKDEKEKTLWKQELSLLHRIEAQCSQMIGLFKMRRKEHESDIKNKKADYEIDIAKCERDPATGCYKSFKSSCGWNNDVGFDVINDIDDIDLNPDQVTLIRKASEIGTQPILMQTVIQVDGDITSYLSTRFLEYPEEMRKFLLGMQRDSIGTATSIWEYLFRAISNLAGAAISKVFSKGGPDKPTT